MIVLSATTDSVLVDLAGAITTNQLRCVATWRDITTTGYTPGRSGVLTNNTTAVDAVPPPAASTQRVIDYLSVYNADTGSATVTVSLDDNGTIYDLTKVTLATGERLEYADGVGFRVFTNAGAVKESINQGNNSPLAGWTRVALGADITNNNAVANSIADITGLSFAVTAATRYWFRFLINYTSAAATTGARFTINGPSLTSLAYGSRYPLTVTTETVNAALTTYDLPAASNASALTTGNLAVVEGIIVPSANGTVIARFASEVASSAIIAKAGSFVDYGTI